LKEPSRELLGSKRRVRVSAFQLGLEQLPIVKL
jgi:hypothetical protein